MLHKSSYSGRDYMMMAAPEKPIFHKRQSPLVGTGWDRQKGAPFGQLLALPKDAQPVSTWSNQDEAFVDVAKGIRTAIDNMVEVRKTNLTKYEQAFADTVQQAYPISAVGRTMLQQLQDTLRLKDNDVLSIEERSTTPIREFRQKSLRYRSLAERLIDQDMGSISPSTRSILDALRNELVLHVDDAVRIEEELLKPYREKKGALEKYEEAVLSIQHENPLQDATLDKFKILQDVFHLSDADVA